MSKIISITDIQKSITLDEAFVKFRRKKKVEAKEQDTLDMYEDSYNQFTEFCSRFYKV